MSDLWRYGKLAAQLTKSVMALSRSGSVRDRLTKAWDAMSPFPLDVAIPESIRADWADLHQLLRRRMMQPPTIKGGNQYHVAIHRMTSQERRRMADFLVRALAETAAARGPMRRGR